LNDWLSNNYNELKNICNKFSTPEEVDDLLHLCIEQFIKNKKVHQIPDKEKLYFFTKIVRNQYHSKSSKYHYTYRRYQFSDVVETEIPDVVYEEDKFNMEWVKKGHRRGANTNNVSATISIKEDEWESVGQWMWKYKETFNGLSVLPYFGGSYVQAPFEDITEEQFNEMAANLHTIDLTKIVEFGDDTNLMDQAACAGGACEIV
jgi:hypothetical protein